MSEQIQVSGAPIIVVNDLTKSYDGKINAIMEISLSIAKGEFTVLFGPSGVGKSTLLRCLNYLVEPTSGDVIVDGVQKGEGDWGFDAEDGVWGHMFERGIVDPAKVTRAAVENAASVAGMVLTTESVVTDLPEKHAAAPAMPDMHDF